MNQLERKRAYKEAFALLDEAERLLKEAARKHALKAAKKAA